MFEVLLSKKAIKFLDKQDKKTKEDIITKLKQLENYPDTPELNIKRFQSLNDVIRLRTGNIRVIIKVNEKDKVLLVSKIGYRGDVYK